MVTEWYAPFGRVGRLIRRAGWRTLARAFSARTSELPDELITALNYVGLKERIRTQWAMRFGAVADATLKSDIAYANAVARLQLAEHDGFFGYSYASLETMREEKKRGKFCILDQIDPGAVEFRLVADEMKRHPEIAGLPPEFPAAYFDRSQREWKLADVILVNSEWSREALMEQGVPPEKLEVLPLAYEAVKSGEMTEDANLASGCRPPVSDVHPLKVLWLGQVNVRKGFHHLLAAAQILERENVHFDVVGPIGVLPGIVASAPRNVTFHGPATRDRAVEWYLQSELFILPTLSDGFALTQLEAMAHGLPVIATPNCGRVVEEGKTGFIIPPRDPEALAAAILKFVADRNLSSAMSPACLESVKTYSLAAYGRRLIEIIEKHCRR